jgi:hypothetical protein
MRRVDRVTSPVDVTPMGSIPYVLAATRAAAIWVVAPMWGEFLRAKVSRK